MQAVLRVISLTTMIAALTVGVAWGITYEYDSLNRLIRVEYDDGREIFYEYDATGNIIWVGPTDIATATKSINDPRFLQIRGSFPNPFSHSATILFEIRATQKVGAKVYDVRGREVTTLAAVEMEPGVRRIGWNGADGNGITVASGVYFVQIETEHARQSTRVLLVR
jgi:YD repeat-containing protein